MNLKLKNKLNLNNYKQKIFCYNKNPLKTKI